MGTYYCTTTETSSASTSTRYEDLDQYELQYHCHHQHHYSDEDCYTEATIVPLLPMILTLLILPPWLPLTYTTPPTPAVAAAAAAAAAATTVVASRATI